MLGRRIFGFGLPVLIGAIVMGGVWWWNDRQAGEECTYKLINPQRCEERLRFSSPDYKTTENIILGKIEGWKEQGVTSVAVQFRDLRNGPTIIIDPGDSFLAMSLYKLPILIRYLKDSEGDPGLLDEQVVASRSDQIEQQNLPPEQTVVDGATYTVRQLLERLMKYSDNQSWNILVQRYQSQHPDYQIVVDTLAELGIIDPTTQPDPRLVGLKSISSIFRILYNASYLNLKQSQYALELLSQSTFDGGIAASVPSSLTVANKFGFSSLNGRVQLHDCGIVFYPDHPYTMCVMTKGSDQKTLETVIASISKIVYDEVARRYP